MTSDDTTQGGYDFTAIEKKWQSYWIKNKTFRTDDLSDKPKYYVLDMFPYPSGDGLHVGHAENYTASDIYARYKRMRGFNVLHPMGWDAFGLPAEQYAIKTNTHPKDTTRKNISNFRRQILNLGYSADWDREVDTTDPEYYKWTQWIFLKLHERGLAYKAAIAVNWCPKLGTVLANEEVVDGKSEVGGYPVEKRMIKQWVLRITEYAERLLQDLELVDWPESTKEMQRNWIGKSVGCNITFGIKNHPDLNFQCFSTRADTLFGATFCVLAPEHPLVKHITEQSRRHEVETYVQAAQHKSDTDRTDLTREKTGVMTGAFAINPVNNETIPIYIADYVLMNYGTGAIMAVPGHDERDHAFAKKYGIPIKRVLAGSEDIDAKSYTGDLEVVNSGFLNGLRKDAAITKIGAWLQERKIGNPTTTYRMRDWIFSRQRYWGEPFPVAEDEHGNVITIPESDLPVLLPPMEDYKPTGTEDPPLSKAKEWRNLKLGGKTYQRECNIMPQWAGSCWYYLRYIDPHNNKAAWDTKKEKYWLPVDLYIGGVEHANLHLLYARFWHKVLYDMGLVSTLEPFKKVIHQGTILGENNEKMSKSRGNVVNPDTVIAEWGADSLRLYEMFLGPLEAMKPWQTHGIVGVHRFIKRIWKMLIDDSGNVAARVGNTDDSLTVQRARAVMTKRVTDDTERLQFNTAISAMMEFINVAYKEETLSVAAAENLVLLLAPYAPHVAEEIWERLGHSQTLTYESWPTYDETLLETETITLPVMVNGKTRGTIDIDKNLTQEKILAFALEQDFVKRHTDGKQIAKEIFVPGKVVNFLVK